MQDFKLVLDLNLHKTTLGTTMVPAISHLRAGNYSNSNEKRKTLSVNKYINDLKITGITQVSIRDRFRPNAFLTRNSRLA